MLFNWIYKKAYVRSLFKISQYFPLKDKTHVSVNTTKEKVDTRLFIEMDEEATYLGDRYRGIGVTVGLFGVLIVFCAVAPIGFQSGHTTTLVFTIVKILTMLSMAYLVWKTINSKLRSRWIEARLNAEILRYKHLRDLIEWLNNNPDDEVKSDKLVIELEKIFDEQIEYNQLKSIQYRSIVTFSERLGWIGFLIALVGACMHLFMHDSWLIFPTAFVPALVGTIHGINGFLHLSDLSEDHASMANRLDKTRKEIKEFRSDPKKILELSKAVYQILTNRDVQWVETAEKLGLKIS